MSLRRALSTGAALALVAVAAPLASPPAYAVKCGGALQPECKPPTTEIDESVGTPAEVSPGWHETANRNASFTFKVKEDSTNVVYQCKIEKIGSPVTSQFGPCSSPKAYPGLADGDYKFSVQALQKPDDPLNVGLVKPVPGTIDTFVWEVDGSEGDPGSDAGPPTVGFADRPPFWLTDNWFSFDLVANEPTSRFLCNLDGKNLPCSNGQWNHFGNAPGDHTARIWAVDLDGNKSARPAVAKFAIPVSAEYLTKRRGGWKIRTGNKHMRHLFLTSSNRGATITHGFNRKKKIVLLVGKGPGHGSVKVLINRKVVKKIKLSAPEELGKQLIRIKSYKRRSNPGLVQVVVTSRGKPVVIEALGFSRR